MKLALSHREATLLDDVLGMWIEGIEEEVPSLATTQQEAHWSMYELRRQKEIASRLRMRIACERRDSPDEDQ